jgi:Chaperone of endosialidase
LSIRLLRLSVILISLTFAFFALSPQVRATCQEGCSITNNTFLGDNALISNITSNDNTAIGFQALLSNTIGNYNTAIGSQALYNSNGYDNTANGYQALYNNTSGSVNTANGFQALLSNTTGLANTANGAFALQQNTTGEDNTASGDSALGSNTTGNFNTANGEYALSTNTTGSDNTANGSNALRANTIGIRNVANGLSALAANTSGSQNTADGVNSLFKNTTSVGNVAIGYNALFNNTTGGSNTAVGLAAGSKLTTGSNNIDVANTGVAGEGSTIRIGTTGTQTNTYIAGVSGVTVAGGVGVIIDSSGHLGTVVSSERFKDDIKLMDKASEAVLALKPVTFRYKHELDPDGIQQFGLVAEQVEKVNPALVARDADGKVYTVRYEAVNAMLLNEFLKEHRTVRELKSLAAKQEASIAQQQKQIEALTAGLQKVSAQVEMSRPAPQTVVDNH